MVSDPYHNWNSDMDPHYHRIWIHFLQTINFLTHQCRTDMQTDRQTYRVVLSAAFCSQKYKILLLHSVIKCCFDQLGVWIPRKFIWIRIQGTIKALNPDPFQKLFYPQYISKRERFICDMHFLKNGNIYV